MRRDFAIDDERLTLTADAVTAWRDALKRSDLSADLKTALERLVAGCAKREWGKDAYCEFNREVGLAIIEHFDGRKKIL